MTQLVTYEREDMRNPPISFSKEDIIDMEKVFGSFPITLSKVHIDKLDTLDLLDSCASGPYRKIMEAINKYGPIVLSKSKSE